MVRASVEAGHLDGSIPVVTTDEEHLLAAIREAINEGVAGFEATVVEGDGGDAALATFTITSPDTSTASLRAVIVSPTQMLVYVGDHGAQFRSIAGHDLTLRRVLAALLSGRIETAERINKTVYFMDGDRWRCLGRLPLGRRTRRRRRTYGPYPAAAGRADQPAPGTSLSG